MKKNTTPVTSNIAKKVRPQQRKTIKYILPMVRLARTQPNFYAAEEAMRIERQLIRRLNFLSCKN